MIENVERKENFFFIKVGGKITKEDVGYVAPMIEKMIVECKKIKLLVYLHDVAGYTFGGFIADFLFYFKYMNAFKRVAVVGSGEKDSAMVEKFKKFFPCNAKYFDVAKLHEAEEWISKA